MKRFVGFVVAVAALVALVCFKTFKITILGVENEMTILEICKESEALKFLFDTIIDCFKSGDKEQILNAVVLCVGTVGLALSLLLAGLSKKFGRFFWGLVTVAICVAYALITNGKVLEEYGVLSVLLGFVPYIGYYIAGGAGLALMILPIVWRD